MKLFSKLFISLFFTVFSTSHFATESIKHMTEEVQTFDHHPFPNKLSAWKIFLVNENTLSLNERVVPFDLVNPLFTDYAQKFRTVWIPAGSKITYKNDSFLEYPRGSIITKTFAYPIDKIDIGRNHPVPYNYVDETLPLSNLHRVETRILVKTSLGWVGLPYVWDDDQKDATLKLIGTSFNYKLRHDEIGEREFTYGVPNFNQCKGCHIKQVDFTKKVKPIGPNPINLNRFYAYKNGVENQLEHWKNIGILENLPSKSVIPKIPKWDDETKPVVARARAYLDINCAHCHNPHGPASTSGLYLSLKIQNPSQLGICKSPVATGNGGSGRLYDVVPGDPEGSILHARLSSENPAIMMPEIGRSLEHKKGVDLIARWIGGLDGHCD